MALYIVVMGVTLVVLYGAYRSMGGEPPTPEVSAVTLERVIELMRGELPASDPEGPPEDLVARAHASRRSLSGLQFTLEQLDLGPADSHPGVSRELLRTAAADLTWACRLIESGALPEDEGVTAAVVALRRNALRCLDLAVKAPSQPVTA